MRLLELHREATFELTDGSDAAALLELVRERVAHHGAERLRLTPIPLLGWAAFVFLAQLVGRAMVGARFGNLLERTLRPHARPLEHR